MPLINCKVELSLKWYEKCLLTVANTATFKITDTKRYVPIVTLSIEGNVKLSKLLSERFKRPVYWNKNKIVSNKIYNENNYIRELLDVSNQGFKRLFDLAYRDHGGANIVTADSHRGYSLPRIKIENYNIEIDGRNFYDHPINDLIKQCDKYQCAKSDKYQQDKVMITQLFGY